MFFIGLMEETHLVASALLGLGFWLEFSHASPFSKELTGARKVRIVSSLYFLHLRLGFAERLMDLKRKLAIFSLAYF